MGIASSKVMLRSQPGLASILRWVLVAEVSFFDSDFMVSFVRGLSVLLKESALSQVLHRLLNFSAGIHLNRVMPCDRLADQSPLCHQGRMRDDVLRQRLPESAAPWILSLLLEWSSRVYPMRVQRRKRKYKHENEHERGHGQNPTIEGH